MYIFVHMVTENATLVFNALHGVIFISPNAGVLEVKFELHHNFTFSTVPKNYLVNASSTHSKEFWKNFLGQEVPALQ